MSKRRTFKLGTPQGTPHQFCINCGTPLEMGAAVLEKGEDPNVAIKPNESFTVCIRCGHLMMYGDKLVLREPTPEEQTAIAASPALIALQQARLRVLLEAAVKGVDSEGQPISQIKKPPPKRGN